MYGKNIEKKVGEAGYSGWEILGSSEERAEGIFLRHAGTKEDGDRVCQAGEAGLDSGIF